MTANHSLPLVGALIVLASLHPSAQARQAAGLSTNKTGVGAVARVDATRLLSSPRSDLVSVIHRDLYARRGEDHDAGADDQEQRNSTDRSGAAASCRRRGI